ncbi:hypothetical protein I545_4899 [Mycobacterium kansasii 662]|uniref:Uncharacterized protein n=2 Tax=Mycobacterium kansasii TaxID=1768 RepID=A0A1V3WWL0_MYCKA|nr:hypothetical protein I547_2342 [Mycobacterium kansasii 824]EUA13473.1 hypothetical protein I545_4899 [Mycobacterium kansasii 662]KEP44609.1 hypothetical protein MKSMC1_02280 [Mycobacterium kansasii]OOK71315.1 hypothetical protein BZL29_5889 [Mycobacterium kansasii]
MSPQQPGGYRIGIERRTINQCAEGCRHLDVNGHKSVVNPARVMVARRAA